MSRRRGGWQWSPNSSTNHNTGRKAKAAGATFEEEIQWASDFYAALKQAKWKKLDPVRVKTRKGIISLENPFLDFVGTIAPGRAMWFEAKSTITPYLDISCSANSRGLEQTQKDIIREQVALGANPFVLWEYRWKDHPFSKVMFIPHSEILSDKTRLNAADYPNIRRGIHIHIVEAYREHYGST